MHSDRGGEGTSESGEIEFFHDFNLLFLKHSKTLRETVIVILVGFVKSKKIFSLIYP